MEGRAVDIVCPNFGEIFGTVSCEIPTDKFVLDEVWEPSEQPGLGGVDH